MLKYHFVKEIFRYLCSYHDSIGQSNRTNEEIKRIKNTDKIRTKSVKKLKIERSIWRKKSYWTYSILLDKIIEHVMLQRCQKKRFNEIVHLWKSLDLMKIEMLYQLCCQKVMYENRHNKLIKSCSGVAVFD